MNRKNIRSIAMLIITLACQMTSPALFGQSPQKMSYQAVIRNSSNQLITNSSVGMKISILQGSISGTVVYTETQMPSTNANGLVTIDIGSGAGFSAINWANGPYFIKTETDPSGGNNYNIIGTSQLLSVPYALHSRTSESLTGAITELDPIFGSSVAGGITGTDITNWNNKLDSEADGSVTNELQVLSIGHDTVFLTNGGFVKLPAGFDGQYASLAGAPANVSFFTNDAGYLTSFTEVDGSVSNEIQALSISHDTIFLTNGGFVNLAPYHDTQWALNGNNINNTNTGNVGIGTNGPICLLDVNGPIKATNLPFNVKSYGAKGNGSTVPADVTAESSAVNSAVTAWLAAAASGNGATLYFPAGTYVLNPTNAGLIMNAAVGAHLTICGDGMGTTIIRSSSVSVVLWLGTGYSHVNIHDLTLDGNATSRTAGQHALIFDASYSAIRNVEILNSGQFSMAIGQNSTHTQVVDITVEGCHVRNGYADGINFGFVDKGIISGNLIDGADDDCIAVGCNYLGNQYFATKIVVSGNICRSRTDLGTAWGRGILILGAQDVTVTGNLIENIKQDGIKIISENTSYRSTNIMIYGNIVKNVAINSGNAIGAYLATEVDIQFNKIINPVNGSAISVGDWQGLTIANNTMISTQDKFFRSISAIEGTSIEGLNFSSPFNDLKIVNNSFSQTNAGSNTQYNECVRINPGGPSRWVHRNTVIAGNVANIASGNSSSPYLDVDWCDIATKIINNTCIQVRTISTGGNNIVPPLTINNN